MTPLQENLQMAKRTGQRAFDYAMNAKEEANKLAIALQHTYDAADGKAHIMKDGKTQREIIGEKHDILVEKSRKILAAAEKISAALDDLYNLDMSEFF